MFSNTLQDITGSHSVNLVVLKNTSYSRYQLSKRIHQKTPSISINEIHGILQELNNRELASVSHYLNWYSSFFDFYLIFKSETLKRSTSNLEF
jgi:hypothetical protein